MHATVTIHVGSREEITVELRRYDGGDHAYVDREGKIAHYRATAFWTLSVGPVNFYITNPEQILNLSAQLGNFAQEVLRQTRQEANQDKPTT